MKSYSNAAVKIFAVLCSLCLMAAVIPFFPSAKESSIKIAYTYDVSREDMNFSVSDSCSEHLCFEQFAVSEKGYIAVYYALTVTEEAPYGTYSRVSIDILDNSGKLIKEISFDTKVHLAVTFYDDLLVICFDTHAFTYDWNTDTLAGYRFENADKDLLNRLSKSEIRSGDWVYKTKKTTHGYTELTRENGTEKETLLSLPGTGFSVWKTVVTALSVAVSSVVILVVLKKHNKKQNAGQ